MNVAPTPPPGLYARLLGESWSRLDAAVRRMHVEDAPVNAAGVFRVTYGTNRLTRLFARLGGLPRAGENIPVRLTIIPHADREEWRRCFDGRPFVTWQWAGDNGWLIEQFGRSLLRLRVEEKDGQLHYTSAGGGLRLGRLRVPLPKWLMVAVTAVEKATVGRLSESSVGPDHAQDHSRLGESCNSGGAHATAVFVEVRAPLLGRIVCYEGVIEPLEETSK